MTMPNPTALKASLSKFFQLPVDCRRIDTGKYSVRPEVFGRRHGYSLILECNVSGSATCKLQMDQYGSDIINAWSVNAKTTAEGAYEFFADECPTGRIALVVDGNKCSTAIELLSRESNSWKPANVALKASVKAVADETDEELISTLAHAALGFSVLLANIYESIDFSMFSDEKEGAASVVERSVYERSRANRLRCIAAHGAKCAVCGAEFGNLYGSFAYGFIEVHHRTPVSTLGEETVVDPVRDLVPLCPNCHAAVHLHDPMLTPEELKEIIEEQRKS